MSGAARRPSTVERGYGGAHQALRAKWAPLVAAGLVYCHEPVCIEASRRIEPGSDWDLAHLPDRSGWRGPAHSACNTAEANRRRRAPAGEFPRFRTSQRWR
jgi:hypothetical protein